MPAPVRSSQQGWDAHTKTTKTDHQEAERWRPLVWCPNTKCQNHEQPGGQHIRFQRRYGTQPTQLLYECRTCKGTFSLRRQTPLFDLRMDDETFFEIVKCLGEGNGIRETARIKHVKPDTVLRVVRRMGRHAEKVMKHHMRDLCPNEV